jgi:predicted nucleic acid-binding protein
MLHSSRFTALLDANVLYPAPLRDFLLCLAELELYKPKWSASIQEEWIRNLLQNRPDLKREWLAKTSAAMNAAFPDAAVQGYEKLITGLSLPDRNDRHVVAAAIRGKADVIITCNTKDFPSSILRTFDLEVQHPDEFVLSLIGLDGSGCQQALENQVKSLKNPPLTKDEVLAKLEQCGLVKSVALL